MEGEIVGVRLFSIRYIPKISYRFTEAGLKKARLRPLTIEAAGHLFWNTTAFQVHVAY